MHPPQPSWKCHYKVGTALSVRCRLLVCEARRDRWTNCQSIVYVLQGEISAHDKHRTTVVSLRGNVHQLLRSLCFSLRIMRHQGCKYSHLPANKFHMIRVKELQTITGSHNVHEVELFLGKKKIVRVHRLPVPTCELVCTHDFSNQHHENVHVTNTSPTAQSSCLLSLLTAVYFIVKRIKQQLE